MPPNALVALDVADHIGDGSAHAEQMPGYVVSILDEIAEAKRNCMSDDLLAGLTIAYRAVLRHRFALRGSSIPYALPGRVLVDTWTDDDLARFSPLDDGIDAASAANNLNADVFAARIDRDIEEGGL